LPIVLIVKTASALFDNSSEGAVLGTVDAVFPDPALLLVSCDVGCRIAEREGYGNPGEELAELMGS
jgi:hypothetical protein